MDKIEEILTRGVVNIIPGKEKLKALLESNKKLNIYLGIDPTATRIHVGNAVTLRKLQAFAELGHKITFLIGDFTALIGDTSDKESERPILTYEEIQENFKTYKKQAEKILDYSKVEVGFNSEWLGELKFKEIIKLCQHFSIGDFVSRELIRERLSSGKKVGLHETLYPVMQGYDSWQLKTDIQIGGADQTFNMQAGRTLISDLDSRESFVLVTGYLEGTDGRKMSKSWGNAIWLEDEPSEMYGKVMSLKDELINNYFVLATNMPLTEIPTKGNPMDLKKQLAFRIVSELHSEKEAQKAQEDFEKTFQDKTPEFQTITVPSSKKTLVEILTFVLGTSISETKRLIISGAVDVDNKVVLDPKQEIANNSKIKSGKRNFFEIKFT